MIRQVLSSYQHARPDGTGFYFESQGMDGALCLLLRVAVANGVDVSAFPGNGARAKTLAWLRTFGPNDLVDYAAIAWQSKIEKGL